MGGHQVLILSVFCYLHVKQKLCRERLHARASIIKNERVNNINISLQFPGRIVRRMIHFARGNLPDAHVHIQYYVGMCALVSSLADNRRQAAVAMQIAATEDTAQPLAR